MNIYAKFSNGLLILVFGSMVCGSMYVSYASATYNARVKMNPDEPLIPKSYKISERVHMKIINFKETK